MEATDGPSTSTVPAAVADPTLAAGPTPVDTPMLPAVRAVTDASFQLFYGSDAQSDSSAADPASDNTSASSPSVLTASATTTTAAPRRTGRQHKPAAEY